jgi:hypothetical protein
MWLDGRGLEPSAALGGDDLEVGERGEVPIGDGLVDQGPEVFGRLKLRPGGRQEHQADAVGDGQAHGAVPAGVVEHEHDAARAPRPGLLCEGGQRGGEERLRQAGGEIPHHLAAGRPHEGADVQPSVAAMPERDRPFADGSPDPAADRLRVEAGRTQCVQPSSAQTSTGRSGCAASARATAASSPF